MTENPWLHLFSSNIRKLYVDDAVDLLAAPEGFIYQFRYSAEHVQDKAKEIWHDRKGGLVGTRVALYFSLQHAANFHPAAYVPLRYGQVTGAFAEGRTYVVRFTLARYAPLPRPDQGRIDALVHSFTSDLRELLSSETPDNPENGEDGKDLRRSAILGPPPGVRLDQVGSEGSRFEAAVAYLTEALGPQQARSFFRLSSIWKGSERKRQVTLSKDGYLDLVAGNHYTFEFAHFQPASLPPREIKISAAPGTVLLSAEEVTLRSRYDVMPISVFAPFRDDEAQGEMEVRVKLPNEGASLRLPVRVRPSKGHTTAFPLLGIAGAFLVATPAIMGEGADLKCRLVIASIGAFLVGAAAVARKSRGLS